MNTLVLALYVEGRTDGRFLPIIVRRTVEGILIQHSLRVVDVLDPIIINQNIDHRSNQVNRILEAARRAKGYHALIIHADADSNTQRRALEERIWPGIEAARGRDDTCSLLIPLVPVRMTEAWMLVDPEALTQVIGTALNPEDLKLPSPPRLVESEPHPKRRLEQAIQQALAHRPRRRRQMKTGEIYEPLAREISLERLQSVPAYQQFVNDLTDALRQLGLITT